MAENSVTSAAKDIEVPRPAGPKKFSPGKSFGAPLGADVKKRWAYLGFGLTAALVGASVLMTDNTPTRAPRQAPVTSVDTTPKGLTTQQDWKAQTGAELQALKKAVSDSQAAQRELLARMEALRQEAAAAKAGTNTAQAKPTSRIDFTLPPPPTAPTFPSVPAQNSQAQGQSSSGNLTPTAPQASGSSAGSIGNSVPGVIQRRSARAFTADGSSSGGAESGESTIENMVTNEKAGFLPAGSFAAASLLSGVEAITGGTAQSQPQPIVIHVDENAILPNAAGYRIKGCHVLASVYGDLSSERVFGRLATLTCVDADNRMVLSEEVEGNLVDSDGKLGIRGKFQDRQSAKVGRALLAGFTEGMASAFGKAQTTTSITGTGAVSALTGSAAKAAGYGGMDAAARQLADFYMKQAEATMPIIAVDAGRKISILFTKSKALKFESINQYKVQRDKKVQVERS